MNIIIVAGGLGTRFKELSCFPKVLLPTKEKDSILLEQIGYFSKWDDITIIINEKFYVMVLNYIEANNLTNVKVISSSNTNGSGNTIASVYDKLPKKDVMFFWSDIVFERNAFERSEGFRIPDEEVVVYTSNDAKYRYLINDGKISNVSETYNGNIPGIFYINDISRVIPEVREEETDLVDFIIEAQNRGFIKKITSKSLPAPIIEYRSLEDYKTILGMSLYKRAFAKPNNQWNINKDWVIHDKHSFIGWEEQRDWANARNYILDDAITMDVHKDIDGTFIKLNAISGMNKLFVDLNEEDKQEALGALKKCINSQKKISKKSNVLELANIVDELVDNAIHGYTGVCNMLLNDPIGKDLFEFFRKTLKKQAYISNGILNPIHGNLNEYTIVVNEFNLVYLIHHNSNMGFFGWQEIDEAAYTRIKLGIDDLMRQPIVYGDKSILNRYDCYNDSKLESISWTHRIMNVLYVLAHLNDVSTDVMKLNIMFDWVKFEVNNIQKNIDLNKENNINISDRVYDRI